MRHMRSRRILAMLLALSMIFGLLTTTAFADNEVDQNPSNVGESAANGTSEVGSSEGQSSGASEDESSEVTNNEDVPTEEETTPEEKKTTSSEEGDTQEGEGENSVTGTSNLVVVNGETGYDTLEAAMAVAEPVNGTITYTINGKVEVTSTETWIKILPKNSTASKVAFVGSGTDAEICIANPTSILADNESNNDIDVSFENLTLSHPNGKWIDDVANASNYFTCWLRDTNASDNTVTYTNCTFPNGVCNNQFGKTVFTTCNFTAASGWSLWHTGTGSSELTDCTFSGARGVKLYAEGERGTSGDVTLNNVSLNLNDAEKAAVEITKPGKVTMTNVSVTGATAGTIKKNFTDKYKTEDGIEAVTVAATGTGIGGTFEAKAENNVAKEEFNISAGSFDISAVDTETFKDYLAPNAQISADGTVSSGATPATGVATVGSNTYPTLKEAFEAANNNDSIIINAGIYEMSDLSYLSGKTVTVSAQTDAEVTFDNAGAVNLGSANVTFQNIIFDYMPNQNYTGLQHAGDLTYEGCTFNGMVFLYGNSETFNTCTFNQTEADAYNVWTYGAKNVAFNSCTFNCVGKSVLVYNEGANAKTDLNVNDTKFNASAPVEGKAAIEIDTSLMTEGATITVDANTTAHGFAAGSNSGSTLWNDKNQTADTNKNTTVTVANETVFAPKSESSDAIVDEKTLRKALYEAPADGTKTTIKLESDITLEMLYAAENFGTEKLEDNAAGDTFNRYKLGAHPTEDDPDHWNPLVTNQSQEARLLYGAYYHMNATDERIARLVVKAGQDIVLDLNGHTIQKDPRATHGDWSNTCTDILANYGTLTITDTSTGAEGTIKGNGYISCDGAVLHNYAGATMNVGAINVDGNAAGMSKGTGQYVVVNEGGTLSIDGANIFDTATSASLLVNTAGTMSVKHATLSHPATKTFNVKGGTVEINEGVEITSDTYAIFVKGGTVKLNANVSIKASSEATTPGTLAIEGETAKVEKAVGVEMEAPAGYKWENNVLVKAPEAKKVAKVGDTDYPTLKEAVAAVDETNSTITLLTDVIQNTSLSISKSLTLDLNGHKIYNTVDIWHDSTGDGDPNIVSLISIDGGASVTVTGNGTIDAKENDCYTINVVNGELTIENGTFYGNVSVVQVEQGKLTVNGGSFALRQKWPGKHYLFNCIDDAYKENTANVEIYGGTFDDFDPNVAPEAAVDGKTPSFAAPGVGIEKNSDGTFTAVKDMTAQLLDADGNSVKAYASLADAIAAAEAGQTVRLLADAKEDVTINKNITLDLGGKTLTNTGAGKATVYVPKDVKATVKNGIVMGGASYYNIAVGTEAAPGGELTLIGVTATAGNDGSSMIDNWGTLTIESGTYTGGMNTVKSEEGSTLVINGGTFTCDYGKKWSYTAVILVYGDTTINGGTFIQKTTNTSSYAKVVMTGKVDGYDAITKITGGSFTNEKLSGIFHGYTPATADNFEVSGGTFNKYVSDSYFKTGYVCVKNENGTYGVAEGKIVAEVGNTGYTSFEAAIAAANALTRSGTIYLRENLTVDYPIVIENAKNKAITLNLQGHTLTSTYAMGTSGAYALVNKTSLTIKNGTFAAGQARAISAYAALTLNGVTVTQTLTGGHACVAFSAKDTTYTVKNSTINGAYSVCVFANNATVAISESTLIGTGNTLYHNGSNYGLKLTVTDSTITSSGGCGVYISGSTTTVEQGGMQQAKFTNCTITGAENGVEVKYTNLTLDNCTVATTATEASYPGNNNGSAANGFAVVSTDNTVDKAVTPKPEGTVTITGANGKYTGLVGLGSLASIKTDYPAFKDETVKVSGGTFDHAIPYEYCAAGYIPVKNGENSYGVKKGTYVAEVNGTGYETLAEAFAAATDNSTIKLLTDITIEGSKGLEVKAGNGKKNVAPNVTFDLNGHKIDGSNVSQSTTLPAALTILAGYDSNWLGSVTITSSVEGAAIIGQLPLQINASGYADAIRVVVEPSVSLTVLDGGTNAILLNNSPIYLVASDTSKAFYKNGGFMATVGEESRIYETLGGAKTFNKEVKLLNDYKTSNLKVWNSWGAVTLDLDSHICEFTEKANMIELQEGANITFKNGTLKGSGASVIGMPNNNSTLTLDSVAVENAGNFGIATNGTTTNQTVTINNSTIKVPNGMGVYFPSTGKLTINGGSIEANTGVQICAGSLEITGNPTIKATATAAEAISSGSILDGAAVSIVGGRSGYGVMGQVTIDSGSFTSASGIEAVQAYTVNSNNQKADWTDAEAKVNISGGTYSSEVDAALCKNGFECTKTGSVYTVIPATEDAVAVIGSVTYSTLDAALATAKNGDKVVVIKDTETTNIIVPIGVRLDLNGHTVTASTVFSLGDVRDTQKGAGKLIVAKSAVTFQASTSYMPLYDVDGYRFFQYRFGTNKVTANADKTEVYNEIYLTFWDDEAYQILRRNAGEGHGLKLGLDVTWDAAKANNQNWYIDLPADVLAKLLDDLYTNNKNPINQVFTLTIVGVDSLGEQTMYIRGSITSTTWAGRIINYGQEFQVDLKK